jgi:tol-pal system protein YbgF
MPGPFCYRWRTMRAIRTSFILLLLAASSLPAQKTNDLIKELQRDLASLQQDVKNLNSKFDEKIAVISTLLQQALTEAGSASKGVAILDRQIKDSLKAQEGLVASSLAPLSSKVDSLTTEYSAVNENIRDLTSRTQKIQGQITEVLNVLKVMSAPPVRPPDQPSATQGGPPPGVTPDQVYKQAMADKESGNYELGLREFEDFLKFWPNSELAPNAQFYIGEIKYYQKDYEAAIQAFDTVIEKYPDNNKTPDAMFLKGRSLLSSDQKNKARQVFTETAKIYPSTDAGKKAKGVLAGMAAPPAQKKRGR